MLDTSKIYTSKNHGIFSILKYKNNREVQIKFLSTGAVVTARADHISSGKVKDPLKPMVYSAGYIGQGDYKSRVKGKNTIAYTTWSNMIERCYCNKYQKRRPSYKDCTVCDEWLNFQNFAEWFYENYTPLLHLDKDKKQKGIVSKVYSPETCAFIEAKENSKIANSKNYIFKNPCGELIFVNNLSDFCVVNYLSRFSMSKVHDSQQESHKGWTKA